MSSFHRFLCYGVTILIISALAACSGNKTQSYKREGNSINFKIGDANLKINVLDSAIMQVRYSLVDNFSSKSSLILEDKEWDEVSFDVTEKNNQIVISTNKMKAHVNTETGE